MNEESHFLPSSLLPSDDSFESLFWSRNVATDTVVGASVPDAAVGDEDVRLFVIPAPPSSESASTEATPQLDLYCPRRVVTIVIVGRGDGELVALGSVVGRSIDSYCCVREGDNVGTDEEGRGERRWSVVVAEFGAQRKYR